MQNEDDEPAKVLIEDDCSQVGKYTGCFAYEEKWAVSMENFVYTSPNGPLSGFEDLNIHGSGAWANDSPSRGIYEADGSTCASTQYIEFAPPAGETRKFFLKEMHHKKRGDNPTTDIAFVPAIKIEFYDGSAWGTYYSSDTYPDGKIPTGLTPDSLD